MYDAAVCLMKMISSAGEIALMGIIGSSQDEGGDLWRLMAAAMVVRWPDAWRAFHPPLLPRPATQLADAILVSV